MGEVGDRAKELAEAAMAGAAIIGDDFKVEVSLVGLILSLKESVTAGFAEMRTHLARKADKTDLDVLRAEIGTAVMRVEVLERWRADWEREEDVQSSHAARDRRRLVLAAKIATVVWGMATTVAIILATAGVFHL